MEHIKINDDSIGIAVKDWLEGSVKGRSYFTGIYLAGIPQKLQI